MTTPERCPHCDSSKIIPDARVIEHDEGYAAAIEVEVCELPDARIDTERRGHHSPVGAWLCGACGHLQLHATDPAVLWEAHEARQAHAH